MYSRRRVVPLFVGRVAELQLGTRNYPTQHRHMYSGSRFSIDLEPIRDSSLPCLNNRMHPAAKFAEDIAGLREPVVLVGGPCSRWPALQRWADVSYIEAKVPRLTKVYRLNGTTFQYRGMCRFVARSAVPSRPGMSRAKPALGTSRGASPRQSCAPVLNSSCLRLQTTSALCRHRTTDGTK